MNRNVMIGNFFLYPVGSCIPGILGQILSRTWRVRPFIGKYTGYNGEIKSSHVGCMSAVTRLYLDFDA